MRNSNVFLFSLVVFFALGNSFLIGEEPQKTPIADLIDQLDHRSHEVHTAGRVLQLRHAREQAIKALAERGKAAVPALIEAAKSERRQVQIGAMRALGEIGPDAKDAVPVLIERLHDHNQNGHVGVAAAKALGNIGPAAANAAPDLLQYLIKDWTFAGHHIGPALEKLGPDAAPSVFKVLDSTTKQREIAALVGILCHYGTEHATPLLSHQSRTVRMEACRVLSTEKEALCEVAKLLEDDDVAVRSVAAYCLHQYGEEAVTALETLESLLSDKHADVRQSAAHGIAGIGTRANSARPALLAVSKDDQVEQVRISASYALAQIGFEQDAVAGYIRTLKSPSPARYVAAYQLGMLGPRAKEAVAALSEALADPDYEIRAYSAEALGRIGLAAQAALPTLEKLAKSKTRPANKALGNAIVRVKATEAIKRIRASADNSSTP